MRAWLFYDVKFNGTRLMVAGEDDPGAPAFLHDYLDRCDLLAMPRLPVPKRVAPHAGFWCTLAMKHLVGIRTAALRPDRLWRDSVAARGRAYQQGGDEVWRRLRRHRRRRDSHPIPCWPFSKRTRRRRVARRGWMRLRLSASEVRWLKGCGRAFARFAPGPVVADGVTRSPPRCAVERTAWGAHDAR